MIKSQGVRRVQGNGRRILKMMDHELHQTQSRKDRGRQCRGAREAGSMGSQGSERTVVQESLVRKVGDWEVAPESRALHPVIFR